MGKPTGFKEFDREEQPYRDINTRLKDYKEIYTPTDEDNLNKQSARCMDCGIPFCMSSNGCPVSNLIPEWNDLIYRGRWREASDRLHKTNNFPEFTGRVCPAPCEGSCVLDHVDEPVTIKNIENAIVNRAFEEGWIVPQPPINRTGKKVAIVGSGPSGLAAAAQLNKAGHHVTVYERADRVGGLLMYGIPNMKLSKEVVDRRVHLLREEGIEFITNANVGGHGDNAVDVHKLRQDHDALLFATGATIGKDLPIHNRHLKGIHLAMDFLKADTKSLLDSQHEDGAYLSAKNKNVIVIGGGDTGTDCIATSIRHRAKNIVNFELMPQPSLEREENNPWPQWPKIMRTDYGHEEAKKLNAGNDPRVYSIMSKEFIGDDEDHVIGIKTIQVEWISDGHRWSMKEIEGTEKIWEADLVLLSMGFIGPEKYISDRVALDHDDHSNYKATYGQFTTNQEGIFVAGDCRRGQSLVVWAIREGRDAAREIDRFLMGNTLLP